MKVNCLHCGVELPAENLNITLALAKCSQCHHLFNFANPSGELSVPQPQRFQVNRAGNELTISWRWYEHQLWFMLLFCILWDGFLITWYGALLTCWNGKFELIMLLPILFPLGHVAVGVGLTYSVLMGFFNNTVIRVTAEGEVIVRHGPLPWCGN